MTNVAFGRLTDLSPRDAWKNEAHNFTPWLAENIEHLSEVDRRPTRTDGD